MGLRKESRSGKIHLQFIRKNSLRSSAANYVVYGESGRFPLEIIVKLRMSKCWSKLIQNESKLSSIFYRQPNV